MTTLSILKAARARITDPKRWTQGAAARDRRGYETENLKRAACWCALGSVCVADCGGDIFDDAVEVLDAASPFGCGAILVNDKLGHAATLAMFDRAIARLEGSTK